MIAAAAPQVAAAAGTAQEEPAQSATPSPGSDLHVHWRLLYHENFGKPLPINSASWVRDRMTPSSPWHVKYFGENGKYYHIMGGPEFARDIDSFWLMRKRVAFGTKHWLTAELAQEDYTKTSNVTDGPTVTRTRLESGGHGAVLKERNNTSGVVIRSTKPLPPEYRIQYTLRTINFGGKRHGALTYDGKYNGYNPDQCNTSYPWNGGGDYSGPRNPCNANFADSTTENGYYFLYITDSAPAPHDNIVIHSRKVGFDAFNVDFKPYNGAWVCNAKTGKLYPYTAGSRNYINATFSDGSRLSPYLFPGQVYQTPCGTFTNQNSNTGLVESAEIQPELMPSQSYTFAIERTATGYTLEMTGNFRHVGHATIREHRDFVQGGIPIWHYNNTAKQYNGQFDQSMTDTGKYGSFTIPHVWPKGSHYPDYFVIGDPHLNYYEGSATISNVRLYVPKKNQP
jgi:hypothetical protein